MSSSATLSSREKVMFSSREPHSQEGVFILIESSSQGNIMSPSMKLKFFLDI